MIHSIVSLDDIFYNENAVKTEFRKVDGGLLEVVSGDAQNRTFRLHSTDPYLYLSKRYFPDGVR